MNHIIPFREEPIEDAARLVSERYQRLRQQVPDLPQRFSSVSSLAPQLQDILKPDVPGVAAIQVNRMVGLLTAWQRPDFRGERITGSSSDHRGIGP